MRLMPERRDPERRAELTRRLVDWVRQQTRPFTTVPDAITHPSIAQRVIKRLALRGLARHVGDGWLPSPVLQQATPVQQGDAA